MAKTKVYYDPQCLELAEYFLERPAGLGTQVDLGRVHRLAQLIQETVEAFLEDEAEDERSEG